MMNNRNNFLTTIHNIHKINYYLCMKNKIDYRPPNNIVIGIEGLNLTRFGHDDQRQYFY